MTKTSMKISDTRLKTKGAKAEGEDKKQDKHEDDNDGKPAQ